MKKLGYFIIVLIILVGGYYFYAQKNKQAIAPTVENGGFLKEDAGTEPEEPGEQTPAATSSAPSSSPIETNQNGTQSTGTFSGGEEGAGLAPDVLVVQVDFDGTAFTPASVDIKVGDIVIFKNSSSQDFWPASAPHPTHTDYAEFDAKQAISPGGKFQFKFEKAGAWKYHNHLNPSIEGVINVTAK